MTMQLREWWDRRRATTEKLIQPSARAELLTRVRQTWIEDVQDRSVERQVQTALGLDRLAGAPPHGWAAAALRKAFDAESRLLIVGPQGSGKTTALLELLHDLLDRADNDAQRPIPVVFSLASWARRRLPLRPWLIDELVQRYDVPLWKAKSWVERDRAVMPLLDSLDEVPHKYRDRCVEEINKFLLEPSVGLVVCSCTAAYASLRVPLELGQPFVVQPLTSEQIADYCDAAGDQLAAVKHALSAGPRVVPSPLVLNILAVTYEGQPAGWPAPSTTSELFTRYVERMFTRRSLVISPQQERAIDWLGTLARSMRRHGLREFDPGRLQPEWLAGNWARRFVTLAPLVVGPIGGALIGLIVLQGIGLTNEVLASVFGRTIIGPSVGPGVPRLFALISGLVIASVVILGERAYIWFGKVGRPGFTFVRRVMVLGVVGVGTLAVAWAYFARSAVLLLLLFGMVLGRAGWLYRTREREGARLTTAPIDPIERTYPRVSKRGAGPVTLRVLGVVVGLIGMRVAIQALDSGGAGLLVLVSAVLVSELISELAPRLAAAFSGKRAMPNQQIRRSAGYSMAVGLGVGLVVWLSFGLFYRMYFGVHIGPDAALRFGLSIGLGLGLLVGAVFGLIFGGIAFLRHYVLRALLAIRRETPWRYIRFLDEMVDRLLLYRSGGSYVFIHPLLLDHFAGIHTSLPGV